MSRPIVPLGDIAHRLPEGGRIRIGTSEKARSTQGKVFDRPVKLDRFRFTSKDEGALHEIAAIYGGTVRPWNHDKVAAGQWELLSEANEIRIVLPNDPLGDTPIYEAYDGGGRSRRCDGETCDLVVSGPDGGEIQQVPCLCFAKQEAICKVTTHLTVLLPEIKFGGAWRLTSHGWNVAEEMPGFVAAIRQLQEQGFKRGLLRVEERVQVANGKRKEFMVPVLAVDMSLDAIAAGAARVGQLGASSGVPALAAGSGGTVVDEGPAVSPDDEIVDAEIVDESTSLATLLPDGVPTAKALVFARKVSKDHGLPLPTSLEAVTDEGVIYAVLDEVR